MIKPQGDVPASLSITQPRPAPTAISGDELAGQLHCLAVTGRAA